MPPKTRPRAPLTPPRMPPLGRSMLLRTLLLARWMPPKTPLLAPLTPPKTLLRVLPMPLRKR